MNIVSSMMPVGVETLVKSGHQVFVEASAGVASGFTDEDYVKAGASIVPTHAEAIVGHGDDHQGEGAAGAEIALFRPGQIVFTYFHFAASPELTQACLEAEIVAIAYETIKDAPGRLPCLTPMSEIAGKMSIQEGAKYLEKPMMGRGILLGGVPGVAPADVVVLGAGVVGTHAARVAAGLGANVVLMDINLDRLRYLVDVMPANVQDDFQRCPHRSRTSAAGRSGDRRGADSRRQGAAAGDAAGSGGDAQRQRDRGCGDRPGRLRRNQPADDASAADVCRRGRRALLRDQHARRGGAHEHDRAVQCDAAVCAEDRQSRVTKRPRRRIRGWRRDQSGGGRITNPAVAESLHMQHKPLQAKAG